MKGLSQKQVAAIILITFYQNTAAETATPGMSKHYWAPLESFTATGIPTPPETGSTAGDTATAATGGFVFNTGKGFIDMKNDLSKGSEMDFKSIGDPACPGVESKAKGRAIGLSAKLVEQFKNMIKTPGVLLCKDGDCSSNEYWVVGCDCDAAYMTVDFKSGTKGGNDAKAFTYELTSHCAPYKITLTDTALAALLLS